MSKGLHHLQRRKRLHEKHEPYPHPDKVKRVFDKFIYFGGAIIPITTLPQLLKIWVEKNASGVSLIAWFSFFVAAVVWLIYGILHREKPIIFVYSIWAIIDILIIVGVIFYG